ncbi:MAG: replication factor C large subunit, partial [Candidatus Micrarchaeota archaeon]
MLWTDKYRPRKISEFVGNAELAEEAKKWAIDWERGNRGKPLLLHGPTGVGKNSLALAIAE